MENLARQDLPTGHLGDGAPHQLNPLDSLPSHQGLKRRECLFAGIAGLLWLILFAGGIIIDTTPYRLVVGSGGEASDIHGLLTCWLIILLWYLPTNLALLSGTAGALGAFGNRANLDEDQQSRSGSRAQDNSNPYLSALLRGFFIYLFMTSGLLLLDDAPFTNPTQDQYIRLAGFLSLFSFVVNYNPRVFSSLIISAFQRIQARGGENGTDDARTDIRYARTTAVEVEMVHTAPERVLEPASQQSIRSPEHLRELESNDKIEQSQKGE